MADLRFERTEKMIQLAFLELLKHTSFNEISIAKQPKQVWSIEQLFRMN